MLDLLTVYLSPNMLQLALSHLTRMGELAGGRLEELALMADRNPPRLEIRSRSGVDAERIVKHPACASRTNWAPDPYQVGEAGEGFRQMADMISPSRLANGVRSAGLMRRSVNEALFIARNRTAFGKRLIELPRRQIMKMIVSAEQGRSMVF